MERIRSEIAILTHVHSPSHIDTNELPNHAVKTGDRKFTRHAVIRPDDGRSFSRNVASLNILAHDAINLSHCYTCYIHYMLYW